MFFRRRLPQIFLIDDRRKLEQQPLTINNLILIAVFGVVILLHLAEAGIWAVFYYQRNLFADFETSLYCIFL